MSSGGFGCVSAFQAWAILQRHAETEIGPLRLQELCRDNDRVSSLVAVHNSTICGENQDDDEDGSNERMLLVDLSRQRMTANTLNHLLQLASARNLRKFIEQLSWGGQNDPSDPIVPLRATLPLQGKSSSSNLSHNPHRRSYSNLKYNLAATAAKDNSNNNTSNNNAQQQQTPKTARFEGDIKDKEQQRGILKPNNQQRTTSLATTTTTDSDMDETTAAVSCTPPCSMHMALRVPQRQGYEMLLQDGTNALDGIHYEWNRLERLSNLIRNGSFRGVTGSIIQTCLVIGTGVSLQALKFAYHALQHDERAVSASRTGLQETRLLRGPRNILWTAAAAATGSPVPPPPERQVVFLTNMDAVAIARVCQDLEAGSTLVISVALTGTEETGIVTQLIKQWLLQELGGTSASSSMTASSAGNTGATGSGGGGGTAASSTSTTATSSASNNRRPDLILSKHMMLVTGNHSIASVINKPESVHLIPQNCRTEAFTTFTAATLLPLGICFGWNLAQEFIQGAHNVDQHLVNTNPRHNLPILLALTDIWNDVLLGGGTAGRIITPFSQALGLYPAFIAALESQVCGNTNTSRHMMHSPTHDHHANGRSPPPHWGTSGRLQTNKNQYCCSSLIMDGGFAGAYDRSLYQSEASGMINSELILTLDPQMHFNVLRKINAAGPGEQSLADTIHATQDALICSMFAHADELAFGAIPDTSNYNYPRYDPTSPVAGQLGPRPPEQQHQHVMCSTSDPYHRRGNRPSTLVLCNRLDAYTCGQLIALAEHRVAIKAHLCGLEFWHAETGSSLRTPRADHMKEALSTIYHALNDTTTTTMTTVAEDDEEVDEILALAPSTAHMNLSTRTILKHYARLQKNNGNPKTNNNHHHQRRSSA